MIGPKEFIKDFAPKIGCVLQWFDGWLSARAIIAQLQIEDTEANRRNVRAVAESLGSDIISGQAGYKHIDHATPEEVRHFSAWMVSQAEKMTARANAAIARRGL